MENEVGQGHRQRYWIDDAQPLAKGETLVRASCGDDLPHLMTDASSYG